MYDVSQTLKDSIRIHPTFFQIREYQHGTTWDFFNFSLQQNEYIHNAHDFSLIYKDYGDDLGINRHDHQ